MIALLDEVLESVDAARHAAIEAVRKFLSTLKEATPALVDPSRRKTALDADMDLADELSSALMEFPDTGSLRGDIEALLEVLPDFGPAEQRQVAVLFGLVTAARRDPELGAPAVQPDRRTAPLGDSADAETRGRARGDPPGAGSEPGARPSHCDELAVVPAWRDARP